MLDEMRTAVTAWLREVIGCQHVHVGDRLAGATTATIHTCLAIRADGWPEPVAVKVYDRRIEGVGSSDVERDAAALAAAAEVGVAAPRLIDADPSGSRVGWPAIVMTRLPGEPMADGGPAPDEWVDGLAAVLGSIAAAPVPTTELPGFEAWYSLPTEPPPWAADPGPWHEMNDAIERGGPRWHGRFIHRDFHPLNVLWDDGVPSGTVDWVNGCIGPVECDIASCRVNIALADERLDGFALADRFLRRCVDAGLPWDPWWDLEFVAGVCDKPETFLVGAELGARIRLESVQATLDEGVRRALDALG